LSPFGSNKDRRIVLLVGRSLHAGHQECKPKMVYTSLNTLLCIGLR
jgi:hypothetical protein